MRVIIIAMLMVSALPADARTKKHDYGQLAVDCAAVRQLHAQVGRAAMEQIGVAHGITRAQRRAALACLRGR